MLGLERGARVPSCGALAPFPQLALPAVSFRYRLVDAAGGEIGIVEDERPRIAEEDSVRLPDGGSATVVEVYDDEDGTEGEVVATLVVDEG